MASFTSPKSFTQPIAPTQPTPFTAPVAPKSFTPNASGYTLPSLPSVPSLPSLESLNSLPSLQSLRSLSTGASQQTSSVSNYENTEKINSLADVAYNIINRFLPDNFPGKHIIERDRDYGILENIAKVGDFISGPLNLGSASLDLADHIISQTIIPISKGNFAMAGINFLQDMGETLDIAANPVKGMILETYHNGPSGIAKGLYKGTIGRTNYEFDTGYGILDLILEVVVDPFNWISFGGKSALSEGGKIIGGKLDDIAKTFIKDGKNIFAREAIDATSDAGKTLFKNLVKETTEGIEKQGLDALADIIKANGADIFTEEFLDALSSSAIKSLNEMDSISFAVSKGLLKISTVTEPLQVYLTRAACWSSLIPTPYLIKQFKKVPGIQNVMTVLSDHAFKTMQIVTRTEDPLDIKYITKTLSKKENIKKEFDIFQKGLNMTDLMEEVPYLDIEQAFSDSVQNKLLGIRNILKDNIDLTNKKSTAQIIANLLPVDETKIIKKALNTFAKNGDASGLIVELTKLGYAGNDIYDYIKSIISQKSKILNNLNTIYTAQFAKEGAEVSEKLIGNFDFINKLFEKETDDLIELVELAKQKEITTALLENLAKQNPEFKQLAYDLVFQYNSNKRYYDTKLEQLTNLQEIYNKALIAFNKNSKPDALQNSKLIQDIIDTLINKSKAYYKDIDINVLIESLRQIKTKIANNELVDAVLDRRILPALQGALEPFRKELEDVNKIITASKVASIVQDTPLKLISKLRTMSDDIADHLKEFYISLKIDTPKNKNIKSYERLVNNYSQKFLDTLEQNKYIKTLSKIYDPSKNLVDDVFDMLDNIKHSAQSKDFGKADSLIRELTNLVSDNEAKAVFLRDEVLPRIAKNYTGAQTYLKESEKLQQIIDTLKAKQLSYNVVLEKELSENNSGLFNLAKAVEKSRNNIAMAKTSGTYELATDAEFNDFFNKFFNPTETTEAVSKNLDELIESPLFDAQSDVFGGSYKTENLKLVYPEPEEASKAIETVTSTTGGGFYTNLPGRIKENYMYLQWYNEQIQQGIKLSTVEKQEVIGYIEELQRDLNSFVGALDTKQLKEASSELPTKGIKLINYDEDFDNLIKAFSDEPIEKLINPKKDIIQDASAPKKLITPKEYLKSYLDNTDNSENLIAVATDYYNIDLNKLINDSLNGKQISKQELQTLKDVRSKILKYSGDDRRSFIDSLYKAYHTKHPYFTYDNKLIEELNEAYKRLQDVKIKDKSNMLLPYTEAKASAENVLDFFGELKIGVSKNQLIRAELGDKVYITGTNKAISLRNAFMDSQGISPIIDSLLNPEGVDSKTFKAIVQHIMETSQDVGFKDAAQEALVFMQKFQTLRKFFVDVVEDPTLKDYADKLIDSLVKYDKISFYEFYENFDYHVNKIFDNADIGIRSSTQGISLSVDNLTKNYSGKLKQGLASSKMSKAYETFSKEEKEFFEQMATSGETHNAIDDVKLEELLIRLSDELNEANGYTMTDSLGIGGERVFLNENGGTYWTMDIETLNLSDNTGIPEFAAKQFGNNNHNVNYKLINPKKADGTYTWYPPLSTVYTKFKDDIDAGILSLSEARIKYCELFDPALVKDPNTKLLDEKIMAYYINDFFNNIVKNNDTVIGHNIQNFDIPRIQKYLSNINEKYGTKFGIQGAPTKYMFKDSYQDMLNVLSPSVFTPEVRQAFKTHISLLLHSIDNPDLLTSSFFKPVSASDSKNIIEFVSLLQNNLTKEELTKEFPDIVETLTQLKGKINDYIDIDETRALRDNAILFSKKSLEDVEVQKIYKEYIQQAIKDIQLKLFNYPDPLETPKLVKQLNILENLYNSTNIAIKDGKIFNLETQQFINPGALNGIPIGYYKVGDTLLINDFFDYKAITDVYKEGMTRAKLESLQQMSEAMNNIVNNIKRVQLLQDNEEELKQALNQLIDFYRTNHIPINNLDFLRTEELDIRYLFAETKYLYDRLDYLGKTNISELEGSMSTQVLDLLENSQKTLMKDWKDDPLEYFVDKYLEKTIDSKDIAVKNFERRQKDFKDLKNNLQAFAQLSNSEGLVTAVNDRIASQAVPLENLLEEIRHILQDTPNVESQKAFIRCMLDTSESLDAVKLKQLSELAPEDLLNVLCFQSNGVITFNRSFANSYDEAIFKNFIDNKKALEDVGIKIKHNKDTGLTFIYASKDVEFKVASASDTGEAIYELNGKTVNLYKLENIDLGESFRSKLIEQKIKLKDIDGLIDKLSKAQQSIDRVSSYAASGSNYEVIGRSFVESLPSALPKEVVNDMCTSDFLNDALFTHARFNMTYFGDKAFKKQFNASASSDLIENLTNSFTRTVKSATERFHYIDWVMNSGYSFEEFANSCKNLGELTETLEKHPEFTLGAIMKDDKGNYVLRRLTVNTEADLERAKQFGAKLYFDNVFVKMEGAINFEDWATTSPFLDKYSNLVRTYKKGYLMSIGFHARNIIDTFQRNVILANGNPIEAVKRTMQSFKIYSNYNEAIKMMLDWNKTHSGILTRDRAYELLEFQPQLFEHIKNLDGSTFSKADFDFAHSILNEGAFIGEVRSWQTYKDFMKYNKDNNIKFENTKEFAEAYDMFTTQKIYKGFLRQFGEDTENIQRLAGYLILADNGVPASTAVNMLSKTHFDYSNKSKAERLLELVIPFYSFKVRNLHYWLDSLEKYPWLTNAAVDMMKPVWNFDEYDQYELEHNKSLQYNIMAGNIMTKNNLTIKSNSALMDAIQLVTDLPGSVKSSLWTPYQTLVDVIGSAAYENAGTRTQEFLKEGLNINKDIFGKTPVDNLKHILNLVPYGANVTRLITGDQYAKDINNPLPRLVPSMFGRVIRYDPYTPKTYTNYKKYNMSSYTKGASRPSVAYPKKIYPKKMYTRKVYPNTRVYYNKPYSNIPKYPKTFGKYYFSDGFSTGGSFSTWTSMDSAKYNRVYNIPRTNNFSTTSIHDKLYTAKGKKRWDTLLVPTNGYNLKYLIKNKHMYYR